LAAFGPVGEAVLRVSEVYRWRPGRRSGAGLAPPRVSRHHHLRSRDCGRPDPPLFEY